MMRTDRRSPSLAPALLALPVLLVAGCSGSTDAPSAPGSAGVPPAAYVAEGLGLESGGAGEHDGLIRALRDDSGEYAAELIVDYPSDGSIFPPEMAAPTFLWHDETPNVDRWLVDVTFPEGEGRISLLVGGDGPPEGEIDPRCIGEANELYEPTAYQASAKAWKPSAAVWEAIKQASRGSTAAVAFAGFRASDPGSVLSRGRVSLGTSEDPLGAPIFYRDVPLLPSKTKDGVIKPLSKGAVPLIAWRLRDVSREDSRVLLEDMPTCANCHSFSADGKTLGMDIDGPNGDKGAYGIIPVEREMTIEADQVISWNDFEGIRENFVTLGFLSRMSPDGRYALTTLNEELYVQNFLDYKFSQVFYPTRGMLAWYSRETGEIRALPGADDPGYVHCNGVWSPDGKWIVFSRARARESYPVGRPRATYAGDPNETPMRYDLYRIPFNDGAGGTPEPIEGASANGMSNTFPKISPDGRWLVFVKCKNGQLMRPDGKLWIVPLEGGEARRMNCNLPVMNSWHSFSPNGRWMVFSSKSNTPYTQMFLTHLDDEGNDSPAILIENSTAANRAVNIPEFVNVAYEDMVRIDVPAVDHWRHLSRGAELARQGNHENAIREFELALEGKWHAWRSNDWKTHANLGSSLLALGRKTDAIEHIRESLRLHPENAEAHTNLGYALFETGRRDEAVRHLDMAVRINPRQAQPRFNRATIRMSLGDGNGALEDYTEAIRLDPDYAEAYNGRGTLLVRSGNLAAALSDFNSAIRLRPQDPTPWYFRSMIRMQTGDVSGAEQDAQSALQRIGADSPRRADIEKLLREIRSVSRGS